MGRYLTLEKEEEQNPISIIRTIKIKKHQFIDQLGYVHNF